MKGITTKTPSKKTGSMEGMVEMTQTKTMILDQKGKKIQDSTTTHFILLPPHQVPPLGTSPHPSVGEWGKEKRRSRGQGWGRSPDIGGGTPVQSGCWGPSPSNPHNWEKKNKKKENSWEGEK